MWYRIGYFVPGEGVRLRGTHRVNRWCLISGPHSKRFGSDRRKDLCEQLADNMARQADWVLESVITVAEHDLYKYELVSFPWLLIQSAFWANQGK